MRAVEFAIADPGEYTWIGYEKAYRAGNQVTQESKQGNGDGDRKNHEAGNLSTHKKNDDEKAEDEDPFIRTVATGNPLLSGWLNLCSL